MRPYAAVIFDMDGVIVDSEPLHEKAFQAVFEEMGYGQTHGFHFPPEASPRPTSSCTRPTGWA